MLLTACAPVSSTKAARFVEVSFDQVHPDGAPPEVVHVFASVDTSGKVKELDSVMLLARTGTTLSETAWDSANPGRQLVRDWTTCRQHAQLLPEAIPRTIMALETSIVGPEIPPGRATMLSPNTWRIAQGIAVVTVHQFGRTILDRTVSVGLPGRPPGTITEKVSVRRIAGMPDLTARWRASCI
jgi:hypothetical protein